MRRALRTAGSAAPRSRRLALLSVALAASLAAGPPALAQDAGNARPSGNPPLPPFQCVGAENLEDDVFEVPFAAASDRLGDAGRTPLALATELLRREPDRNACILGHARREGGQQTSVNLAARRARAVKDALLRAGLPESRLRSEARVTGFSRDTGNPAARSVSIVVMPAVAPRPERAPPEPAAPPPGTPQPALPEPVPSRTAPDGTASVPPAAPASPLPTPPGAGPAAPPGPTGPAGSPANTGPSAAPAAPSATPIPGGGPVALPSASSPTLPAPNPGDTPPAR